MYSLFWRSPALPFVQKQTAITVPAGAIVSNAASLRFTGKGATNYGKIQQENLIRLLENFAGTAEPDFPTVGQLWYDTAGGLKVCTNTAPGPVIWSQLNSTQVTGPGDPPPTPAALGDTWFSQMGTASGVYYAYTGVGRYPATSFNAYTTGYWPAPATVANLNAILNASSYTAPGTNYNEIYVHGATAGIPADVNGSILVNGTPTTVVKGPCFTQNSVTDGLIVRDPSGTMVSVTVGAEYFCVRRFDDGRWFYDNNGQAASGSLLEFVPTATMYAIGVMTVAEQDNNTAPGVISATMWSEARYLVDIVQSTESGTGIGGWEQIWPAVETHGGRTEYEYMFNQLASLVGTPYPFGGSNAIGRSLQFLTDFSVLDASMHVAYLALLPVDAQVHNLSALNTLKVDPNSQDWDALLSACRYAVNRLELPSGMVDSIAVHPFVQDGLIANPALASFADARKVPDARKVRTRVGTLTMLSSYQETSNALRAAINNRYILAGVLGGSGVTSFSASTATLNQMSYTAPGSSLTGTVTHGLAYEFDSTNLYAESFFNSGGTLQLLMTHTPSGAPSPADTALALITSANGRIRITANRTYVMTPAPTPLLSQAPTALGFMNATVPGIILATLTVGGATIAVRMTKETQFRTAVFINIVSGGVPTGTFTAAWSYIADGETYLNPGPTSVYPIPLVYNAGHKRGSAVFT